VAAGQPAGLASGEYEGGCKGRQDTCIVDIAVLNANAVEGLLQVFAQLRVERGRGCGILSRIRMRTGRAGLLIGNDRCARSGSRVDHGRSRFRIGLGVRWRAGGLLRTLS